MNTNHLPVDGTEELQPQPDILDADDADEVSVSDIPIPRFPIPPPPPGSPQPSFKSDPGYIDPFVDTANVLDAVSIPDIPIPRRPIPPPPGSPPPGESGHDHGFVNPFDDTAIWKTLEQYSSMQRMIRELGEEVETHQQTILSLKDEHAKALKKVKEEHAAELKKTKDKCDEIIKSVRKKELATLELEVECLENENVELKKGTAEMKKKIRDGREWGVEKIESMGYALEEMMFELEKRMGDDKNEPNSQ